MGSYRIKIGIVFLILSFIYGPAAFGYNPQNNEEVVDTTIVKPETISIADVPIQLGEALIEVKRIAEAMITDEVVDDMREANRKLLGELDSLLQIDKGIDLEASNPRFLNNKIGYWRKLSARLDTEKSNFSNNLSNVNDRKKTLLEDMQLWENTKIVLKEENPDESVFERIDQLLFQFDSLSSASHLKSDRLLATLDRTIEMGLIIEEFMVHIDQIALGLADELFELNQHSFFEFDFSDSKTWDLERPLEFFYETEVSGLITYIKDADIPLIAGITLIVLLILIFKIFKKRILSFDVKEDSIYRKILYKILSRSVSAALIIGLFAGSLFFVNRPELLKDILRFIVVFPMVVIVKTFVRRRFHKYVYLFGLVILLHTVYVIFPADSIYYSLILMIISILLIIIFISLGKHYSQRKGGKVARNRIVGFLLYIHGLTAFLGLIALLSGAILLSAILINIPIGSIFGGTLMATTAIIINGLISVAVESPQLLKLNIIRLYGQQLKVKIIKIINTVAVLAWVNALGNIININRPVAKALSDFFNEEIVIGSVEFALTDVGMFFFVIWLSIFIARIIHVILEEDVLNRLKLPKGVPHTAAMLVRYSIITLGLLLAATSTGIPMSSMTVLFGAFGVGIGFGLQNIFNNLVSGLILLFERPIQIGDTVEVGTLLGNVKSIGIRSSKVRTFDGAEVIVPNGQFISNEVVNWTLSDQRKRIEIIAGVAYGSDPHRVRELFMQELQNHPDVMKFPAPLVFFQELGESSLDFRLLFWTGNFDEGLRIRSEVMFLVHDILKKESIEIPFPQRDLHIRSVDPAIDLNKKKSD